LREVYAVTERSINRADIGAEPVCGDLKLLPTRNRLAETFDEGVRGVLIAFAECDVEYELGVAFNRHKRAKKVSLLKYLQHQNAK
jgi:hypothetical protein